MLSARAERARDIARAVLRQPSAAGLDEVVAAARRELGTAGALLSGIADCQLTLSAAGAAAQYTRAGDEHDLEDAVCTNVVRQEATVAIEDARRDPRVSSLPGVQQGMVVSYLGSPVRLGGQVVAVLCVHDTVARAWTADDIDVLERHAAGAATELERMTA
ncbi:GAF domain-containing protein [Jatrophihabitans fulvus]